LLFDASCQIANLCTGAALRHGLGALGARPGRPGGCDPLDPPALGNHARRGSASPAQQSARLSLASLPWKSGPWPKCEKFEAEKRVGGFAARRFRAVLRPPAKFSILRTGRGSNGAYRSEREAETLTLGLGQHRVN
jgi:hypothetical protein